MSALKASYFQDMEIQKNIEIWILKYMKYMYEIVIWILKFRRDVQQVHDVILDY